MPTVRELPGHKGAYGTREWEKPRDWALCLRTAGPGCTLKRMPEALTNESLLLETGADGVIRVRGTRVTLDTVWDAFNEGATAEEIAQQYPSLSLADVYQAIGSCLRNPTQLTSLASSCLSGCFSKPQ